MTTPTMAYFIAATRVPREWLEAAGLERIEFVSLAVTIGTDPAMTIPGTLVRLGWTRNAATRTGRAMTRIDRTVRYESEMELARTFPDGFAAYFWVNGNEGDRVYRVVGTSGIIGDCYAVEPYARFHYEDGAPVIERLQPWGTCPRCDDADVATFDPAPPEAPIPHHVCQACEYEYMTRPELADALVGIPEDEAAAFLTALAEALRGTPIH